LIVEDILNGVEAGQYMYSVMELYPDVFPPGYVGIVKAGELSGSLVNSLEQARIYLESTTKLKQKLRSILVPNIAQFVAIIVLLVVGVIFVTPQIDKIYHLGLIDEEEKKFKAKLDEALKKVNNQ
jgi:type II secretory pathway component PulF